MKVQKIEISFGQPVEFPLGFEQALASLVEMVCAKYQQENPTRVMWASSFGSKPTFSTMDSVFLGRDPTPGAPESGEPTFDDSVYEIGIAEREDFNGNNPFNPERDKIRVQIAAERKSIREKKEKQ